MINDKSQELIVNKGQIKSGRILFPWKRSETVLLFTLGSIMLAFYTCLLWQWIFRAPFHFSDAHLYLS